MSRTSRRKPDASLLMAERELRKAQQACADAQPLVAAQAADVAFVRGQASGTRRGNAVAARGALAGSRALACTRDLNGALRRATWSIHLAREIAPDSELEAWARLQGFEVLELKGEHQRALAGFRALESGVPLRPGWAADVHLNLQNHKISLGMKLGDDSLCREGIVRGTRIEELAGTADERSAFRQWWSIHDIARGRPDTARVRFTESLRDRARTRKRGITKLFPLAHIAFAEGEELLGLELVESGIHEARTCGMTRYADAGERLRERYFPMAA